MIGTYAISVELNKSITNATFGVSGGVMRLHAGNDNKLISGNTFYGNLLIKDGLDQAQRAVDLMDGGVYSVYSEFGFRMWDGGFRDWLQINEATILGGKVTLYRIFGVTSVVEFSGVVDRIELQDRFLSIACVDLGVNGHSVISANAITSESGENYPVTLGTVVDAQYSQFYVESSDFIEFWSNQRFTQIESQILDGSDVESIFVNCAIGSEASIALSLVGKQLTTVIVGGFDVGFIADIASASASGSGQVQIYFASNQDAIQFAVGTIVSVSETTYNAYVSEFECDDIQTTFGSAIDNGVSFVAPTIDATEQPNIELLSVLTRQEIKTWFTKQKMDFTASAGTILNDFPLSFNMFGAGLNRPFHKVYATADATGIVMNTATPEFFYNFFSNNPLANQRVYQNCFIVCAITQQDVADFVNGSTDFTISANTAPSQIRSFLEDRNGDEIDSAINYSESVWSEPLISLGDNEIIIDVLGGWTISKLGLTDGKNYMFDFYLVGGTPDELSDPLRELPVLAASVEARQDQLDVVGEIWDGVVPDFGGNYETGKTPKSALAQAEYIMRRYDAFGASEIDLTTSVAISGKSLPSGLQALNRSNVRDVVNDLCGYDGLVIYPKSNGQRGFAFVNELDTATINFGVSNIIPNTTEVIESDRERVYTKFAVKFGYSYRTGEFSNVAEIKGITESSFDLATCTSGIPAEYSADLEALWDRLRALYIEHGIDQWHPTKELILITNDANKWSTFFRWVDRQIDIHGKPRKMVSFETPIAAHSTALELFSSVTFTDPVLFGGTAVNGLITGLTMSPTNDLYSVVVTIDESVYSVLATEDEDGITTESGLFLGV